VYSLNNQATDFSTDVSNNPGNSATNVWTKKTTFESAGITVTGAAAGDVCAVSAYGQMLKGANTGHTLSCYVSAANTVIVVVSVGNADIVEGDAETRLQNNFPVNIAVFDITA
jgi:hypothetical protein